jgi:tetratricopeptide (TPR) repeat protein
VGVAAYHAEDYAEAARELRAYRRMSGDVGYRAVLADCERALGRPDVALRLVAEALAEGPDAEETVELHIVESGARLDLGEEAAARLVLEGALGGRPDPSSLDGADPATLRLASAYADLLQIQGEESLATEWFTAIAAADPEDLIGAVDRMGIEFFHDDDDDSDDEAQGAEDDSAEDDSDDSDQEPASAPEVVESLPEDDHGLGRSFDEDVEAEVAELLGETDTSTPDAEPDSDQPVGH